MVMLQVGRDGGGFKMVICFACCLVFLFMTSKAESDVCYAQSINYCLYKKILLLSFFSLNRFQFV